MVVLDVVGSVLDRASIFITDACDIIDDVSLAHMIVLRSVPNDVGIIANYNLGFIDNVSPVGTSNICCASYDIYFDNSERARASYVISAAATDPRRHMSGRIRTNYTEIFGTSQW